MTRSAAALVGAALVVGCAPVTTFDMLATSDRDLFEVCKPALLDMVCKDGDIVARADCLESRGAAYGQLHSPRMRRSWLIANGCPEATVDTPPKPEVLAVAPPPAATPNKTAEPAAAPAAPPVAVSPPVAVAQPAPEPPPAIAAAPPPPRAAPPPPPESEPTPPLVTASAPPPEPVAAKVTRPPEPPPAPPPAPSAGTFSDRERGELRERRLRDIIIAHGKEMKSCVDRQLKLVPDLRADGTLIIEVDANGAVPHTELLGTDLAGTPLEACLRTVASRWRFPSNGRAYRIDAPVKVSGSAHGR